MDNSTIKKQHKEKTLTGFLYSIFGVTLPFLLSLIGILMIKKYENIVSFIDDGQILLFSAGLLTSAYYIFREEENQRSLKKSNLKFDRLISHFTIVFLIISSVMYAILYTFSISKVDFDLSTWFIRITSVIIFCFAIYAAYSSTYVDFLKVYPVVDVKKESTKGVKDIMDKL
jgi:Kef-type K+ transport system membrane component KefB